MQKEHNTYANNFTSKKQNKSLRQESTEEKLIQKKTKLDHIVAQAICSCVLTNVT